MPAPRIMNVMLAPGGGGLETMALNYVRALDLQGAEVLSVGLMGSWFEYRLASDRREHHLLRQLSPIDPRQAWRLRRIADGFSPNLVIAHGSRGAAVAIPAMRKSGVPVAVVMHNFRARPIVRDADLVIAVSQIVARDIRQRLPDVRVTAVDNFVELQRGAVRASLHDPPIIGGLGRLHEEKGFDILLDAGALLRDRGRDCVICIGGEGPAREALLGRCDQLNLSDRVEFLHWVGAYDFLSQLDICACPSRTEAFGLVVLEALAAGTPVVATDIEGPREILGHGQYGRLVRTGSAEALADGLEASIDDRAGAVAMAVLAQAEAVDAYDLPAGAERLWAALAPLMSSG
ncbi:MAG TPA: glycosyltransferase [Caulobacteraceae bacterium]|nr:glycosyltransferase [Caulobacteraceae bacterium]